MKLKKISDEGNDYGYDIIEILQFNYDGQGNAIAKFDGRLDFLAQTDLDMILFGNDEGYQTYKIYEPV